MPYAIGRNFKFDHRKKNSQKHHHPNAHMSVRVAPCGTTAMAGSDAELLGMVSMAVQAVP
jgi:hypothetical protein